jgi:hypothetical protein
MRWKELSTSPPKIQGEYVVRSKVNGAKHVLIFNGEYFYKIGNGFQATQFEWLDEGSPSISEDDRDNFAIAFMAWALYDPQAIAMREARISAGDLLEKYKSRPYIDSDTQKQ